MPYVIFNVYYCQFHKSQYLFWIMIFKLELFYFIEKSNSAIIGDVSFETFWVRNNVLPYFVSFSIFSGTMWFTFCNIIIHKSQLWTIYYFLFFVILPLFVYNIRACLNRIGWFNCSTSRKKNDNINVVLHSIK